MSSSIENALGRHLERMLRFDEWANGEIARALAASATPPEGSLRLLGHIVGAEWLWLRRLGFDGAEMAVWPDLPLSRIPGELEALSPAWKTALPTLDAAGLERTITYVNSKGQPWSSRVDDVLTHVVTHGAHHRGQIVAAFRRAGLEPPYVDYIEATRRGWI
ncbi:MAG: DinB family protein [Thermoanaerobaculia bacterium]